VWVVIRSTNALEGSKDGLSISDIEKYGNFLEGFLILEG
jgi:hypothetical protein